jgi:hypothetical protein
MMAVFPFRLASFRFETIMMVVFCFRFAAFCFEEKMMAFFASFFFVSFHFRFASDFYVSHQCETSEKSTFFASKRNRFRFRFASFRFEAKMTAHTPEHSPLKTIRRIIVLSKNKQGRVFCQYFPLVTNALISELTKISGLA